ncbi:hypothetical protein AX16_002202 [Volvariella volvacea WC 439]|nr:hypothetical protein AX16_002202 [Volvariella volvacea WC 439]
MESGSNSPRSVLPSLDLGLFEDPPQWDSSDDKTSAGARNNQPGPDNKDTDSDADDADTNSGDEEEEEEEASEDHFSDSANYYSRNDNSPLVLAAQNNDFQSVEQLLNQGLPIDQVGLHGESALHMSSALGLIEMAQYLIQRGANVNLSDKGGSTPLLHCAQFCHEEPLASEIAQLLIENGADTSRHVLMGLEAMTPLSFAILHQNLSLVQVLGPVTSLGFSMDTAPDLTVSPQKKSTIVHQAITASVKARDTAILEALINMGLPIEPRHLRLAPEDNTFGLLVRKLGLSNADVASDAEEILRARFQGPRSAFPSTLKRLVEGYGVDINKSRVRAFIVSSGIKELLEAAIDYGINIRSLSHETLKELSTGTPREFKDLLTQLRKQQSL